MFLINKKKGFAVILNTRDTFHTFHGVSVLFYKNVINDINDVNNDLLWGVVIEIFFFY